MEEQTISQINLLVGLTDAVVLNHEEINTQIRDGLLRNTGRDVTVVASQKDTNLKGLFLLITTQEPFNLDNDEEGIFLEILFDLVEQFIKTSTYIKTAGIDAATHFNQKLS